MVRFKNRYLVATVTGTSEQMASLDAKGIFAMLKTTIAKSFGDFGAGMTSTVQVRSFDRLSGVCIVRAGTDSHRMVRACLTLLSTSSDGGAKSDKPLWVCVQAVAGCERTLKGAAMEAYATGYARAGLDETAIADLLTQRRAELDTLER